MKKKIFIAVLVILSFHYTLMVRRIFNIPLIFPLFAITIYYIIKRNLFNQYLTYNLEMLILFLTISFMLYALGVIKRDFNDTTVILRFIQYIYISMATWLILNLINSIDLILITFSSVICVSFLLSLIVNIVRGNILQYFLDVKFWNVEYSLVDPEGFTTLFTGFSRQLPEFSYQILMSSCISYYYSISSMMKKKYYNILLVINILGLFIIGQRSSFISFIIFVVLTKNIIKIRQMITKVLKYLMILLIISLIITNNEDIKDIGNRNIIDRLVGINIKDDNRFGAAIVALKSPFYEPIGNGDKSDYYIEYAERVNFFNPYTKNINSAHNHFANIIMQLGLPGYIFILYFILKLFLLRKRTKNKFLYNILLVLILNSFAHNTGIFTVEISTVLIVTIINYSRYLSKKYNSIILYNSM